MLRRVPHLSPTGRWLLIAAASLTEAWLVAPANVPIYDGVGTDAPYRYVDPPPGAPKTPPPTTARKVLRVTNGRSPADYANSGEFGPQISLYIPAGAFRLSPTAHAVTVTATPLAPHPPLPADGRIVTNIYRLDATADAGTLSLVDTGELIPTLQMRSSSYKQPGPVFEHLSAGRWRQAPTLRVGQDLYQASAPSLVDWALVQLAHPAGHGSGAGINLGLLTAGVGILVLALVVLVVRTRRGGRS
jgi:hypothetical protein